MLSLSFKSGKSVYLTSIEGGQSRIYIDYDETKNKLVLTENKKIIDEIYQQQETYIEKHDCSIYFLIVRKVGSKYELRLSFTAPKTTAISREDAFYKQNRRIFNLRKEREN